MFTAPRRRRRGRTSRSSSKMFASVGGSSQISVSRLTVRREGQNIAVEVAHERADGHFQLVGVATLFHEDHEHGTQEARTALVHAVTLLGAPSPGANRSASSSRASSQRSGRCWGKTAAAPRWRTSAENCANRVPFIPLQV